MADKLVYIEDIARQLDEWEGKTVTLRGWLYARRSSGKLHFLQLRDGTGILQCVMFFKDVPEELFRSADHLAQETALAVTGEVRRDKRSPIGFELGVSGLEVIAAPSQEYPIGPKEHGTAFLMDHRHLWLRSRQQWAILRVRHEIIMAIRDFFDKRGFILVDAPIFTPNACEGTSNLFEVGYFDDKAYLTQSGQLYMEAGAMALGKVYCFGPTFRAEKSKTRRHLTEFWMVEPEVAFLELDGVMDLAEDLLTDVMARVLDRRRLELQVLERDTSALERVVKPFPRIRYTEALEILRKAGKEVPFGEDFGGEDETLISQAFDRPVMITHYPAAVKAFYMKRDPQTIASPSAWMSSPPRRPARSSAAASASTTSPSSRLPSSTTACPARPSSGTSTCAATARSPTAASASASSARSAGSAAATTSARPSRSRACWSG